MVTSSRANARVAFLVPSMTGNWNGPFISAQYFFFSNTHCIKKKNLKVWITNTMRHTDCGCSLYYC